MHLPQINSNGTARSDLLELYLDAKSAMEAAIDALNAAAPHPRDYQTYPEPNTVFYAAQREHTDRVMRLRQVRSEIETLAEHIV